MRLSEALTGIEAQSAGGYYIPETSQTLASTMNAKLAKLQLLKMQTA